MEKEIRMERFPMAAIVLQNLLEERARRILSLFTDRVEEDELEDSLVYQSMVDIRSL